MKTFNQTVEELKKTLTKKGDKIELVDKQGYKVTIEKL